MQPRLVRSVALTLLLLLQPELPVQAQDTVGRRGMICPPIPLLEIAIPTPAARNALAGLGLDILTEAPGGVVQVLGWPGQAERLRESGIAYRVVEGDYGRARALEVGAIPGRVPSPAGSVPPFGFGSMGGFYTLDEINAYLDQLTAQDPFGIVSDVVEIGSSLQGRPIRAVRIASESFPDHSRPRVLYTALTHAREPQSMQTLIYFINHLIDGYGTDPEITYLVDSREMWFILCVNPDGYTVNVDTFLGSGFFGYWRKNVRDNNGNGEFDPGADGVDLNRNYGYQWGYDDIGSSSNPAYETYRGAAPFSEPETQAVRSFCIEHEFRTANNMHSWSQLVDLPWEYQAAECPDSTFYVRMADNMVRDSHYGYGIATDILYLVNGGAVDWMYGEQVEKPPILATLTEVGNANDYFWPPQSRIVPIAEANLWTNEALAYTAGSYVHADSAHIVSVNGWLRPGESVPVEITLRNDGVSESGGGITVTVSCDTGGVTLPDSVSTYDPLGVGEAGRPVDPIVVAATGDVVPGTQVELFLDIRDLSGYCLRDTAWIMVGEPTTLFASDARDGIDQWFPTGAWGVEVVEGDSVFSDSPGGSYAGDTDASLFLVEPVSLPGRTRVYLTFETRWAIEPAYDFARIEASSNGGATWIPLEGRMTRPGHGTEGSYGSGTQPAGAPGYDGSKRFLAPDVVDLSAFAGQSDVRLRFRLTSNGFNTWNAPWDGWMLDRVRLQVYYGPESTAGPILTSVRDVPNDQGRQVRLHWQRCLYDAPGAPATVTGYAVFRERTAEEHGEGPTIFPGGRGFRPEGQRVDGWDFLMTVPAFGDTTYQCVVPTLCDSTAADGVCLSTFFIRAMTSDPFDYYDSIPRSGYSVDNIAPSVPTGLRFEPGTILAWNESTDPDLEYYAVYGSFADSLDPLSAKLLGRTDVPLMDVAGTTYPYLFVTGTDSAGNEGEAAGIPNQASGVPGGPSVPERVLLHACRPSPVSGSTTVRFDLPEPSAVLLRLLDVGGRECGTLVDRVFPAGSHQVLWDPNAMGRGLPAGLYVFQLEVGPVVETRKVLLVR